MHEDARAGSAGPADGRRWSRPFARFARGAGRSCAAVAVVAFLLAMALSLAVKWPVPVYHDEFCYLLAADTFAHGRLTNPTHPLWEHFETFHTIQRPSYAPKYPPAQGLALAAGWWLGGHAIVGAWLSTALACAGVCWMLRGWVPPRWALVGGLLAPLHPTILSWSQSFWGGSVALGGGALVLGALPRLLRRRRPRVGDGLALGVGLALLANSRPFEGFVLAALAIGALAVGRLARWRGRDLGILLARVGLPMAAVLAPTLLGMGLLNRAVTGRATTFPYMVYERQYLDIPLFLAAPERPAPAMRHAVMREFREASAAYHREARAHPLRTIGFRLTLYASAYLPPFALVLVGFYPQLLGSCAKHLAWAVMQAPLLMRPGLLWGRRVRLASGLGAAFVALALLPTTYENLHYAAPAAGLAVLLTVHALRHLRAWRWRGRPTGRVLYRGSLAFCLIWLAVFTVHRAGGLRGLSPGGAGGDAHPIERRPALIADLRHRGGRHLVLVRYAEGHNPNEEWVFNGADIDGSPVVWARELDPARNRRLLEYFGDRRAWLFEPDRSPATLAPYPSPAQ